jgi:hypothetical protein
MGVPVKILPEMVFCTGSFHGSHTESSTRQGSLHMLIQHLRAQLPPGVSHAELRWCMKEKCRPDLIEETPRPESPVGLCWAKVLGVYVLSFDIFQAIDGRAKLPIVMF